MSPLGRALLGCSTSRSTISTVRVEGLRMSFVLYDCVSRRKDEVSEMSSSKRSSMSSLRRLRDAFSSSFTSDTSSLTSLTMVERRPNRQSRKTRPAQIPETKYRATRSGRPAGHQTECNMCWCKTHPVPLQQITPELTVPVFFMCVKQVTANVLHFASLLAFTDVCSGFLCTSLFGLY